MLVEPQSDDRHGFIQGGLGVDGVRVREYFCVLSGLLVRAKEVAERTRIHLERCAIRRVFLSFNIRNVESPQRPPINLKAPQLGNPAISTRADFWQDIGMGEPYNITKLICSRMVILYYLRLLVYASIFPQTA